MPLTMFRICINSTNGLLSSQEDCVIVCFLFAPNIGIRVDYRRSSWTLIVIWWGVSTFQNLSELRVVPLISGYNIVPSAVYREIRCFRQCTVFSDVLRTSGRLVEDLGGRQKCVSCRALPRDRGNYVRKFGKLINIIHLTFCAIFWSIILLI